jgi:hypothetical protein
MRVRGVAGRQNNGTSDFEMAGLKSRYHSANISANPKELIASSVDD